MNIFISYTLRDGCLTTGHLTKLEIALADYGSPYIDILHNRSFHRKSFVESKLRTSDVFIGCVTRGFLASPWVRFEIQSAVTRNIPIISINYFDLFRLLSDESMPTALPANLREVGRTFPLIASGEKLRGRVVPFTRDVR